MLKLKHAKDAMVIALVTKTESDDDQAAGATRHVYSPFRLLGFITNLDRTHSGIGIGWSARMYYKSVISVEPVFNY